MGPPRKRWDRQAWITIYAEKGTVKAACEAVRISRNTAYEERKRNPEFAEEWDRQEESVTDQLEKTLIEIALDSTHRHQVRALEFALKARRPSVYREQVGVKHSGKVSVEVDEGVNEEIESALAEVDRLTTRLAEMAPPGEAPLPGRAKGAALAPAGQPGPDTAP